MNSDVLDITRIDLILDSDLPVEWVAVDSLQVGESPRLSGEDPAHTRMLAALGTPLPPIVVHRATMRVVDGAHRLGAARLRRDELIQARMFDGTEQEAFLLGVRANLADGLPLSVTDRTRVAERIIQSCASWSDRTIGAASGLSARRVSAARRRLAATGDTTEDGGARIGRDGRVRPLDSTEGRLKAVAYIRRHPHASLREIARHAGVSPSTANDVRNRLRRGENPVPQQARRPADRRAEPVPAPVEPADVRIPVGPSLDALLDGLKADPSLRFTESGRRLLRWIFTRVVQDHEWNNLAPSVPPHCTYVIADVARRCSQEWQEFADRLERQAAV